MEISAVVFSYSTYALLASNNMELKLEYGKVPEWALQ